MPEAGPNNVEQQTGPLQSATPLPPKPRVNTVLWRSLLLPSLIILALSVGAYLIRPARDLFLSGQTTGNYVLYSLYSVASPYFWAGGVAALLFGVMLVLSFVRTIRRREWVYWQRLLGIIALTASGVLLGITGLPEFGVQSRDAGWVQYDNYQYHLFAQTLPAAPGTDLRLSIFVCDAAGVVCQRYHRDDKDYAAGERIPALELLRIEVDGIFVVVRSNSPTILTKIQP